MAELSIEAILADFGLPKLGLLGWAAQAGRLPRNFMLIRIINRPSGYELSKINDVGIQFAQFAGMEYYTLST